MPHILSCILELELYLLFICRMSTEKNCASGPELP